MGHHALVLYGGALIGDFAIGQEPLDLGSGASAQLVVGGDDVPPSLCQLQLVERELLAITALGEGDVTGPDGRTSFRARLGAGELARVGPLSILHVVREDPFAPSLSGVPYAPAPTVERTELARPDAGEPLALLVRHAGKSWSFPLEGREILVGRFDGKQKDQEAREAEGLLHVPDASVSRRHLSIQRVGGRWVARDLSSQRSRTFVGELPVAEVELVPHAVLRLGPHTDGPTIDLVTVRELTNQPPEDDALAGLVGRDAGMVELRADLLRLFRAREPLLIHGENGSGKGAVARALARLGGRSVPFVAENCASIPSQLFESALFGHKKGAFTGATDDYPGLFVMAAGGVLFLDEVGELPPSMQAKLLRALEEGEFRSVGDPEPKRVACRVVTATNRDLRAMVKAGQFREDLFHRIAVLELRVPPLRERKQDIEALAKLFLARPGERPPKLTEEAVAELLSHSWPGNVRELRNVVCRAAVYAAGPVIDRDVVRKSLVREEPKPPEEGLTGTLPASLEALERQYIAKALSEQRGNVTAAARALGIGRGKLLSRLRHYGME